ncbi:helix-turn-helix domain-containing protein [Streptomyces cacaoi]|uniref:helix-turn-helix domain-containing protein n=1 Tax=Streptomyces cacaoi TaxID=1898 RepID=UPI0037483E85
MPAGGRPTVRSRRLGSTLRRLREAAGADQQRAAEYIAGSKAKISRIEAGHVSARPGDVRLLLELYGVEDPGMCRHLEQLAREANKRGWWMSYRLPDGTSDFFALEQDATCIRSWQTLLIPGLLQTAAYTRELAMGNSSILKPEEAENVVRVRQQRRASFEKSGARFAAVISEHAVSTPMASPATHREQLLDLLAAMDSANISLQILPAADWMTTRCASPFVMLSFDKEWTPTAVGQDTFNNVAIAEAPEVVSAYAHAFERLRSSALTPDGSREFIKQTMAELPEELEPQ